MLRSLLLIIFVSLASVSGQTPGVDLICVPPETCITKGRGIDPRIVTPKDNSPPPVNITCPAGTVACFGVPNGDACGSRHVTGVTAAPGVTINGAYPWQVFLRNQTGYTGSGVLIDRLHVLTAAHKVNLNEKTPSNLEVYIGVHNPTVLGTAQKRSVKSMRIHKDFNSATLKNDIAVLRLNAPIALGYQMNVGSACLPAAGSSYVNQSCTVSGWGQTSFNAGDAPTAPQRQVTVPIVNYATCRASMAQANVLNTDVDTYVDAKTLCAGGQANQDACTQDGGAPLVCENSGRFTVVGLVIWGRSCGQPGVYGAYVDVPKFRAWIDRAVAALN